MEYTRQAAAWMMMGLCVVMGIGTAHGELTAPETEPSSAPAPQPPGTDGKLVVHEWGTFTSVSGTDGISLEWRPLDGPTDLPSFVYTQANPGPDNRPVRGRGKGSGRIRMETPVIYFYSDRPRDISLRVDFPQGTITEWYPRAQVTPPGVNWNPFQVRPGPPPTFPTEPTHNHYYPARETDADPIHVRGEDEKFLFYRGVGDFKLPLKASLTRDAKVQLTHSQQQPLGRLMVFEKRGDKIGFEVLADPARPNATLPRPALNDDLGDVLDRLYTMLIAEGLYPKEASSMIETWRDHWFEDGLRVFYMLPQDLTDTILPLHMTPAPTELVRVLVGRIELLTPEQLDDVHARLLKAHYSAPQRRADLIGALNKDYGRFLEPIIGRIMVRLTTNDPLKNASWMPWTLSKE